MRGGRERKNEDGKGRNRENEIKFEFEQATVFTQVRKGRESSGKRARCWLDSIASTQQTN